MLHAVTQYAWDAVQHKIVVGTFERLACQRHIDDLARAGQLPREIKSKVKRDKNFQWEFDEAKADRVFNFFKYLHHVEGRLAGEPIELIPAHKFDLGSLFGWVHKETWRRRYKKGYIQVARKNAKTTILAGVANYMMVGDGELSPKVYPAAVDKEQARLLYDAAKAMAEKSPDISKRLSIRDYKISHKTRGGTMAPLSKETKNKDGLNPSCAIIDEYHAHPTSEIYDVISSAKGQRAQPLIVIITTAGMDTESPCYKEYQYCKKIVTGKVNDQASERYFVMIRELDKKDDEHDPANWIKSNPLRALDAESMQELREQHDEAYNSEDPAKIRTFRTKNIGVWIQGGRGDQYLTEELLEKWDKLAVSRDELTEMTRGMYANVGVDLSKKIDLTAIGFVFALDDERIAIMMQGYMPEESVTRHEKTDKIAYRHWGEMGWLTITPGNVTDIRRLEDDIEDANADFIHIHEICFDPWQALSFSNNMQERGHTLVEIRQTMANLSEPTKLLRDLIASGKVVHDGSPLLRSCLANAIQITDSKENIMITKKYASDTKRVDLLSGAITALVRLPSLREISQVGDLSGLGF